MMPRRKVFVFDLDDTLYKEVDYVKSAFQYIAHRLADSLPDDYRSQLIDGYAQFLAQQQKARGGINEVRVSRAFTDSTQQYTSVLLVLCYGDSTTEEVIVPMVEHNGRWMMK